VAEGVVAEDGELPGWDGAAEGPVEPGGGVVVGTRVGGPVGAREGSLVEGTPVLGDPVLGAPVLGAPEGPGLGIGSALVLGVAAPVGGGVGLGFPEGGA
jgi:hypothetical protein